MKAYLPSLLIIAFVVASILLISYATNVFVDSVEEEGLKSILEQVWYGSEE